MSPGPAGRSAVRTELDPVGKVAEGNSPVERARWAATGHNHSSGKPDRGLQARVEKRRPHAWHEP